MEKVDYPQVDLNEVTRVCSICNQELPLSVFEKNPNKKFGRGYRCNMCNRKRRHMYKEPFVKLCSTCGSEFSTVREHQKFCSKTCQVSQDRTGDWRFYFNRMLNKDRKELSADVLESLLEKQEGCCALSGVPLTCVMRKGYVPTNASIDRIDAGGEYVLDNIQLVCCIVNTFRLNLPMSEYIDWCKKVVKHNT